jgi:hypothetical protein
MGSSISNLKFHISFSRTLSNAFHFLVDEATLLGAENAPAHDVESSASGRH